MRIASSGNWTTSTLGATMAPNVSDTADANASAVPLVVTSTTRRRAVVRRSSAASVVSIRVDADPVSRRNGYSSPAISTGTTIKPPAIGRI